MIRISHICLAAIFPFTALQTNAQTISLSEKQARIENTRVAIEFDLETGTYSGMDKRDHTIMFRDAVFLLDRGSRMWKTPEQIIRAEEIMH